MSNEFPDEATNRSDLAQQLKDIDERHGRKTAQSIEKYAHAFDTTPLELLQGRVLNIGDPFMKLEEEYPNVIALDYFYGTDVKPEIDQLEVKKTRQGLTNDEEKRLEFIKNWHTETATRLEQGAKAVKGVFPQLPFKSASFDRVISLNAISMHPFQEKGGLTENEWQMWWREIVDVLKPEGKAFIGPFDTLSEHETWRMRKELENLKVAGIIANYIIEEADEYETGSAAYRGPDYVIVTKTSQISNPLIDKQTYEYNQVPLLPDTAERSKDTIIATTSIEKPRATHDFFALNKIVDFRQKGFTPERMDMIDVIEKEATEHAQELHGAKVVPCDVCIGQFVLDNKRKLELGGRIFRESIWYNVEELSPELLEELYPEWDKTASRVDGRVRVHGFDDEGKYVTYCHFCDSDMCLSQHNDGPDWEKESDKKYGPSVEQLFRALNVFFIPEREVAYLVEHWKEETTINPLQAQPLMYRIASATAWGVNIKVLIPPGVVDKERIIFAHDGKEFLIQIENGKHMPIEMVQKIYTPINDQIKDQLYQQLSFFS